MHANVSQAGFELIAGNVEFVEKNHWSECGRETAIANSDALGRPHR